jgi:hypothetical protein
MTLVVFDRTTTVAKGVAISLYMLTLYATIMVISDNVVLAQGNATSQQTGSATPTDPFAAIILASAGIISVFAEWLRRRTQSNNRSESFNKSTEESKDSLGKTDEAVWDHSRLFMELTQLLISDPNLRKLFQEKGNDFLRKVNQDVIEWQKDLGAYYDKKPKLKEDKSKDPQIRKTAEVRKSLVPDYTGIPATTEGEIQSATSLMLLNTKKAQSEDNKDGIRSTSSSAADVLTKLVKLKEEGNININEEEFERIKKALSS